MSYIDDNIMKGREKIVYRTSLHWVVYLSPILLLIVGIPLFSSVNTTPIGVIFVFLAIIQGLSSFIRIKTSEFGVTNMRVMIKVGWIRRQTIETLLNKVEALEVQQGILGRILNFGTVVIVGTGGTKSAYHKIREPLEFRRKVYEQTSCEAAPSK
jgi:uncharacterized membrane protein YdbT with pleckstrin-like domain